MTETIALDVTESELLAVTLEGFITKAVVKALLEPPSEREQVLLAQAMLKWSQHLRDSETFHAKITKIAMMQVLTGGVR